MKKELKQLRKKEAEIRNMISEIEQEEIEKTRKPKLKAMVGKCYAYRNNSYSMPKKKSDYWDVFRKVLGYVDSKERGFHFITENFSVDQGGNTSWTIENVFVYMGRTDDTPFSGYVEIDLKEFDAEKLKLMGEMTMQTKMRNVLESKWD